MNNNDKLERVARAADAYMVAEEELKAALRDWSGSTTHRDYASELLEKENAERVARGELPHDFVVIPTDVQRKNR